MNAKTQSLPFDPEALGRKYREERDKRLRADGNDQYQEVTGEFAYFVEDPYIDSELKREAIEEEVEVVIIGGGFGGMLAAARLHDAGITDFKIVEKGGDFGGTWYWNRYPGASCDIEAYVYFPLLEQTGFVPKQKVHQRARDAWSIATSSPKPTACTSASLMQTLGDIHGLGRRAGTLDCLHRSSGPHQGPLCGAL